MKSKILITGFIGTPHTAQTSLTDQDLRYEYTKKALDELSKNLIDRDIFVAITGDRKTIDRLRDEVTFVRDIHWFDQNPELARYGKGRLEHELIRSSIAHWGLDKKNTKLLKVTAKYNVKNIGSILKYVDKSEAPLTGWKIKFKKMIDTRCFAFQTQDYLKNQIPITLVDDSKNYYYEHFVYKSMISSGGDFLPLRLRPLIYGHSGSENTCVEPTRLTLFAVNLASRLHG